jgi:hypothetical protein
MMKVLVSAAALVLSASAVMAQVEGPRQTDALVGVSSKGDQIPAISDIKIKVNGKDEKLTGWSQVPANGIQVAILIDEGLRQSIGTELNALQAFTKELPEGAQIYVGYMRNGSVFTAQSFTTDHEAASKSFRLPLGSPGISASPYFCLSEFVKHWPTDSSRPGARFVLMVTNGVDPYNGSTSIMNQDSPYVEAAIRDAQRAGVAVSSIYFGDAGFRGGRASFSGQSYLTQVADETGGHALYQGTGNPVSLAPLLSEFRKAISETYVASFVISGSAEKLQRVQAESSLHKVKLTAPQFVRAGNLEGISAE